MTIPENSDTQGPHPSIDSTGSVESMLFALHQSQGRRLTFLAFAIVLTLFAAVAGQVFVPVLLVDRVPWLMLSGLVVLTSGVAAALVHRLPEIICATAQLELVRCPSRLGLEVHE